MLSEFCTIWMLDIFHLELQDLSWKKFVNDWLFCVEKDRQLAAT